MNISQAISKRVMLLCYEKDMTVYELSKKSGVPKTTIKDIISGRSKNPGVISIEKLAVGFSISVLLVEIHICIFKKRYNQ